MNTARPFPHAPRRLLPRRSLAFALSLVFALAGCGGDGEGDGARPQGSSQAAGGGDGLVAAVASYDLAVGPPARFILGLFNDERGEVGYGSLALRFSYLGEKKAQGKPQPGPQATASFLLLPSSQPRGTPPARPIFLPPGERGVYAAEVGFDRAGIWQVGVTAELDRRRSATAAFTVLARHEVPAPGDAAIASQNATTATPGVPPAAIDSRASANSPVPDPQLHQVTVAQALAEHRPVLLVISTPTFCMSRFCGPVTDMVAGLADDYADRARFIHVEVWRDFQAKELEPAAREWIARGENANEPWVFLIGADGRIVARWDNVATRPEIEPLLQQLPTRP